MVSTKLIEIVISAAKKVGVELRWSQKFGENWVILKCKESEWSFKLIYRKYSDNTFLLYASILVHSHVKSAQPQRCQESICDDASLILPSKNNQRDSSNNISKDNTDSIDFSGLDFTETFDPIQNNSENQASKWCEEDKEMDMDEDDENMLVLSMLIFPFNLNSF